MFAPIQQVDRPSLPRLVVLRWRARARALLLAVALGAALAACASSGTNAPDQQAGYYSDEALQRRHQWLLNIVLRRSQRADQARQEAASQTARESQQAWWAMERRKQAAIERQRHARELAYSNGGYFFKIRRLATQKEQQMRQEQLQQWQRFVQRQGRQGPASPTASPGK